jgi:polygalacturonase
VKEPAVIALHAQFSQHVLFEDVDIVVSGDTREEGLLIDSCKYVTVRRLHYGGRGLGFVLASGDGVEGRSVRLPNMHVVLEHSYFSGGVVMVSAMAGGNFNVTYRYLELNGALARREGSEGMPGLKIHARPDITGGESRDILMEHIRFAQHQLGTLFALSLHFMR